MTQEEKDLLFKDLCERLSYKVKLSYRCNHVHTLKALHESGLVVIDDAITNITTTTDIENIKPYLFPLESMTKEQRFECSFAIHLDWSWLDINLETDQFTMITYHTIDFFNRNHLDYRGLIDKGLAIDATNKNIY